MRHRTITIIHTQFRRVHKHTTQCVKYYYYYYFFLSVTVDDSHNITLPIYTELLTLITKCMNTTFGLNDLTRYHHQPKRHTVMRRGRSYLKIRKFLSIFNIRNTPTHIFRVYFYPIYYADELHR